MNKRYINLVNVAKQSFCTMQYLHSTYTVYDNSESVKIY